MIRLLLDPAKQSTNWWLHVVLKRIYSRWSCKHELIWKQYKTCFQGVQKSMCLYFYWKKKTYKLLMLFNWTQRCLISIVVKRTILIFHCVHFITYNIFALGTWMLLTGYQIWWNWAHKIASCFSNKLGQYIQISKRLANTPLLCLTLMHPYLLYRYFVKSNITWTDRSIQFVWSSNVFGVFPISFIHLLQSSIEWTRDHQLSIFATMTANRASLSC